VNKKAYDKQWQADHKGICLDCGKEIKYGSKRCRSCSCKFNFSGKRNYNWHGGIRKHEGYVFILKHDHPRSGKSGYVKRAILVLEEKLGRPIRNGYDSHHINEIKDDDRPENLEERQYGEHRSLHKKKENNPNWRGEK